MSAPVQTPEAVHDEEARRAMEMLAGALVGVLATSVAFFAWAVLA